MACHKLAFKTPEAAERTAAIMQRQGVVGRLGEPPKGWARLYLCPKCSLWHWTSLEASPDGAPSVTVRIPTLPPPPAPEPSPSPPIMVVAPLRPPPPPAPSAVNAPGGTDRQQRHIEAMATRHAAKVNKLIDTNTAAKEALRRAAAALYQDPSRANIIEAIAAMDAVVTLPKAGLDEPEAGLAVRISQKRTWMNRMWNPPEEPTT